MHDFGKLVYLDLHKSGSTFVSQFLTETCTLPLVREWKHQRISRWRHRKSAFYFITVRHPISQYSSLFRYGLDRRGGLYERLERAGRADLYRSDAASFNHWLRFVLNFENAALLGEGLEKIPKEFNLGLLSYRYLMLAILSPERTLSKKPRSVSLSEYVRERTIVNYVIRNENLNEGLTELATKLRPAYFDQGKVEEFFALKRKVNMSTVKSEEIDRIDGDVKKLIEEKEHILLEFYSSGSRW